MSTLRVDTLQSLDNSVTIDLNDLLYTGNAHDTDVKLTLGGTLDEAIKYVTPEMFGAVSYPRYTMFGANNNSSADIAAAVLAGVVVDSTAAIQAAVNTGRPVKFDQVYYTSAPIIQNAASSYLIGRGPQESGIVKYTNTPGSEFSVDAVVVSGQATTYMRNKGVIGLALSRTKLLVNDGTLQQAKAVENFFNYLDVNLIPAGYGLYVRKGDHYTVENVLLHGHETNFYTTDLWMSRFSTVWAQGGTGFVIETGTSITMEQVWSIQASWNTFDTGGSLIKKHYCYDIGGVYHDLSSVAADFSGADGRPTENIYNFRQGAIVNGSSIGIEQCHARRMIYMTPGASAFTTSFVNFETVSFDTFYNKYGDVSLAGKRRVLIDVGDYCSLRLGQGRIRSVYADTTSAPQKPHIAYVGKKSHLNMGAVYFFIDTIKGVQLNDSSYFTSTNFTTGVISPVAATLSEVWVDSDSTQASSFQIANGVLDINVAGAASDLFWDNGSISSIGSGAHRFGGYNARIHNTSDVAAFRVQSPSRAASFITTGTSIGLYDYNVNQWILRQDQSTAGSALTLGSKLAIQDVALNFQTSGTGAAFDSRILGRTTSSVSSLYAQAAQLSPFTDNSMQLGGPSNRWSVVYAGTATINTSDLNSKTDVAELSDSEIRVAKKLAKQYRTYKLKEGSSGRTHVGAIAQWVMDTFSSEGLDPLQYGICCYDEWEAQAEEVDEAGNLVSPAVEAGSRYGLRYEELNSFVNAGLNAWLIDLEDRLASLEK